MTKPFSLQPLVHLAQQKNNAATRKLGQLNQQHQSAQEKMNALQQYRKDYQAKFQESIKLGMEPADLRNFQDFINRLDQAIRQQKTAIEQSENSVQTGRHELRDATRKMKSFDTLAQRHIESERKLEAKSEQRIQDEQSGRFASLHSAEKQNEK